MFTLADFHRDTPGGARPDAVSHNADNRHSASAAGAIGARPCPVRRSLRGMAQLEQDRARVAVVIARGALHVPIIFPVEQIGDAERVAPVVAEAIAQVCVEGGRKPGAVVISFALPKGHPAPPPKHEQESSIAMSRCPNIRAFPIGKSAGTNSGATFVIVDQGVRSTRTQSLDQAER